MKTKLYWLATGLFCLVFAAGGTANLLKAPPQVEAMTILGYPTYMMTILGVFKILGVIALLAPGFPILKEWAYAGFTFDMLGASASHAFVGDPLSATITPLVILAIGVASYRLRPDSRRVKA